MTDQEIVNLTLNKDKNKFILIVERYERQIIAYVARLLNFHQQNAEDVASQTFMKAYINLASYNQNLKFSSWLYRIAHNESINFIKLNQSSLDLDKQPENLATLETNYLDKKFSLEAAYQILNKLNKQDSNLLILFYLQEKSIAEISEILKISQNSAKSRLSQARKKAQVFSGKKI